MRYLKKLRLSRWGDEQVSGLVEAVASQWAGEKIVSKAEAWHYWRCELRTEKEKNQGVGVTFRLLLLFFFQTVRMEDAYVLFD